MPNTNKLPKDLQDKLIKWEQNKPEFRSAKMLEDIGLIVEDMSNTLAEQSKDGKAFSKDLGVILLDMRASLSAFNSKDELVIPDYAKPVVEALNTLESAIAKSIGKIDLKPTFNPTIQVDSPKVDVSVPDIDLRGIEKVLKKDIPAAFDKAIKSMPKMEMPENDLSPLLDVLTEVSNKLDSIDTATRMKPQPGSMKVTSDTLATEATLIEVRDAINGNPSTNFALYGSTSDATYDYVGKQSADGKWYVMRVHKVTGVATYAVGDSDMATSWAGVAGLTYGDWDTYNQATATIAESSNSKPFLVDENGIESQMLGDNYYQGAPITIDVAHHEIHCGDSVVYSEVTDLTNGAERNILLVTPIPNPTTKRYHLTIEVESESEIDYKFYEDTTTSNNGTGVTSYNRNRQDPVVVPANEITFTHTPTVTGVGTLLETEHFGSGRGMGGGVRGGSEWVLKNNAKYLIKVKNETANANQLTIRLNYYVHPGV